MKIERISLFALRMPLVHFFETSFGRKTHRSSLIVRVDAEGLSGYGECPPDNVPLYAGETVDSCALVLERHLIPLVLGASIESVPDLLLRIAPVRGNHFARAGLEAAFADCVARSRGVSLSALYGGAREAIDVGVSIGIQDSYEDLVDRISSFVDEGYRRIKMKIKPGWDIEAVEAVRRSFPEVPLMVDANAAYRFEEDADRLRALDAYELLMIEQPFHQADLIDHSRLQTSMRTPICLDESITDRHLARAALALGATRVVNVKASRVGGVTEARAIHDLCRDAGIPVWCGGLLETGIGRAHNLALASLEGFTMPGDVSASARYYSPDVIDPPVTMSADGSIRVPTGPGLGFAVNESVLREYAFSTRELRA